MAGKWASFGDWLWWCDEYASGWVEWTPATIYLMKVMTFPANEMDLKMKTMQTLHKERTRQWTGEINELLGEPQLPGEINEELRSGHGDHSR